MGWKRELRRIESASRRASREEETRKRKINRKADTTLNRIDRDASTIRGRVQRLHERLLKDPIKPLDLRYEPGRGFRSTPFQYEGEVLSGSVTITADSASGKLQLSPSRVASEHFSVEPVDLMFSVYGIMAAIRVSNFDQEYRIRLSWFKKSNPAESAIYLVDPVNSVYYYPRASNLTGEVIPEHPRLGIIAFEPLRHATDKLEIHISGAKLSSQRGKTPPFQFEVQGESLLKQTTEAINGTDLLDYVKREVETTQAKAHSQVNQIRNNALKGGCAGMILLVCMLGLSLTALMSL